MKKIHAWAYDPAPNESDPEGYEYSLCNRDENADDPKGSHDWAKVTCKFCLKEIGRIHK